MSQNKEIQSKKKLHYAISDVDKQEEAKNAKKFKKGTGRGKGGPRKLVESKLTPDENDNLSESEILCSSCETKMAEEKKNTSKCLSCEDCPNLKIQKFSS
ncbi:hypothetical protein BpHYR1_044696 [Brachionus plicatilis]|uniref:Uncharacterized protein n=1 Tax=Brachionus plicatilis TaxID=10195 RepID=A0A3M7PMA9_BRAPC|nr:hypothetical protein BpHYR1_044696 [Brachionus plicatilis]